MYTGRRIQSDSELDGTPTMVKHKGYTTDEDDLDGNAAMANAFGTSDEEGEGRRLTGYKESSLPPDSSLSFQDAEPPFNGATSDAAG
ncbi:hypothetical protein JCM1840_005186 [Sporobolomyces johnsonii]